MNLVGQFWLPEGVPRSQQVDAEIACQRALSAWERRTEARLSREDREDALSSLRDAAISASRRFDPSRGVPFRNFLHTTLYHRATDWLRQDEGRTVWKFSGSVYERERQTTVSLDAPIGHGDDGDTRSLGDTIAAPDQSAQTDWNQALGRLHRERDSAAAEDRRRIDAAVFEVDAEGISSRQKGLAA